MVIGDYEIWPRNIVSREKLVITLNARVDSEHRPAHIPVARQNMDRCAEDRADLPNVRICPESRDDRSHSRNRRVGIERQCPFRREADLESAREQKLPK